VGKVKISLRPGVSASGAADIRADGRLNSFLGEYDRELDGPDATEPLEFEEQFILRVPKEVEQGRGGEVGLREMIKGKGKGLEGIEFKFLGMSIRPYHTP
jgi:transcription initiation factor TFIID subunit 7